MPSLVCHQLSYTWPNGAEVFRELTATFPDGRTGIVGRNGVGKSTLLEILAGRRSPTSGSVSGPQRRGYLPQDPVTDPSLEVAEVLGVAPALDALDRLERGVGTEHDLAVVGDDWDVAERTAAVVADLGFADLALDRPLRTLSGGEVMLLSLAARLLARPDVLILDEPTNNLDVDARRRLRNALSRWRRPLIVVSHDRELLADVDAIAELRMGGLSVYGGDFAAYTAAVEVEQESAEQAVRSARADLKRQQRELVEAQTKLDRRRRYAKLQAATGGVPKIMANHLKNSSEKAAGRLKGEHQADVAAARKQLEESVDRLRDEVSIRIDLADTRVPPSRDVAIMAGVELRNGVRVDLHVRGPERVAIVGPNGCGKTTLLETLLGLVAPAAGECQVKVPWRYLPQRLALLDPDESVLGGVSRLAPEADELRLRSRLARFELGAELIQRPFRTLSGGERFRATLAALLLAEPPPQLLVLDEPTNNLDLDSVAQLVGALGAYEGALLVVSHDRPFLDELDLTRVVELGAARRAPTSTDF